MAKPSERLHALENKQSTTIRPSERLHALGGGNTTNNTVGARYDQHLNTVNTIRNKVAENAETVSNDTYDYNDYLDAQKWLDAHADEYKRASANSSSAQYYDATRAKANLFQRSDDFTVQKYADRLAKGKELKLDSNLDAYGNIVKIGEGRYGDIGKYVHSEDYRKSQVEPLAGLGGGRKYNYTNLDKMNANETLIFDTFVNEGDYEGAKAYLDEIQTNLDRRRTEEIEGKIEEGRGTVMGDIGLTLASAPLRAIGNITGGIESVRHTLHNEEPNPYSDANLLSNIANKSRETVSEDISSLGNGGFGAKTLSFLYDTGNSMIDSVIGASTLGVAYAPLMGLGAGADRIRDLYEQGATKEQALIGGALSGIAEAAFEYLSLEHLVKNINPANVKEVVKYALTQAGVEGSEEVFTEIANIISDDAVMGSLSERRRLVNELKALDYSDDAIRSVVAKQIVKRVGLAFLGGAISGGVLGGVRGASVYNELGNKGRELRESGKTDDVVYNAEMLTNLAPDTFEQAKNHLEGVRNNTPTDAELGALYYETRGADSVRDEETEYRDRAKEILSQNKDMSRTDAMYSAIEENFDLPEEVKVKARENYDGKMSPVAYLNNYKLAYTYGKNGINTDYVSIAKRNIALTENAFKSAYEAGAVSRSTEIRKIEAIQRAAVEARLASGEPVEAGKVTMDSFTYEGTEYDGVDLAKMSKSKAQRVGGWMTFAKALAEATGVNISLYEGKLDAQGKRLSNRNGFYSPSTNTIYIDVNASDKSGTKSAFISTVSHELTHWMENKASGVYEQMRTHILDVLSKERGVSVETLIANQLGVMAENSSEEDAVSEIVAQSCENMLKNSEVAKKYLNGLDENTRSQFVATLKQFIANIKAFFDRILSDSKGEWTHYESVIFGELAEAGAELQRLWDEGFEFSVQYNQTGNVAGVSMAETVNDATDGTDIYELGSEKEVESIGDKMSTVTEYEPLVKEQISITKSSASRKKMDITIDGRKFNGTANVRNLRNARLSETMKKEGATPKAINAEISRINNFIDDVKDFMEKAKLKYTYVGLQDIEDATIIISPTTDTIVLSCLVKNGEYQINFDFTKTCKKRIALQQVVEQLVMEKGRKNADGTTTEVDLSPENIRHISEVLAANGVETACLCCFVEAKRYFMQERIQVDVCDVWNSLIDKVNAEEGIKTKDVYFDLAGKNVNDSKIPDKEYDQYYEEITKWRNTTGHPADAKGKMETFIRNTPSARKKLRMSDFVTETGRTNLHKLYPEIEGLANTAMGNSVFKSVESFAPYNGEIELMSVTDEKGIEQFVKDIAGVRSQSFSDFIITHLFDVLQKTAGMSARRLVAHVYTKEISRAILFGMTGEKHNLSVLHEVSRDVDSWSAGLDADGNYILSDYEAFASGKASQIQAIPDRQSIELQNNPNYSRDVGRIGVGFSFRHMMKMLNDPDIRQVIGYHTSQMPAEIKPLTNLDKAADYTKVQNTLTFKGFKLVKTQLPEDIPSYATVPQDFDIKYEKTDLTFDIKGTYEKLAKTMDSTTAAKESLRQLLEFANSNHLSFDIAKAELHAGNFSLYEDTEKTQNPYLTADHYIEYCIKDGKIPMFFEFALNPNYYKNLYDFNVFDRLSYNPATGLHEDGYNGYRAYAPQNPVTFTFPDNFIDLADKFMRDYNFQREDFANKLPKVMKEVKAIKNNAGESMVTKNSTNDDVFYVTDNQGHNVPVLGDKIFSRQEIETDFDSVSDRIYYYLKQLIGTNVKVKSNGDVIWFDRTFANEYAHSTDTYQNSRGRRKVIKANAIKVVREMIENADLPTHSIEKSEEHYADFSNGADYYNVRIAVENGMTGDFDIFEGILTTRIDKQKKRFAYDISKLTKKETVNAETRKNAVSPRELSPSLKKIIPLSENTSRVKNSSTDDVAYHAGDLGKAEPLSSQGYSRGTGHFGTGTYFVSNTNALVGSYGQRPIETVNLAKYNLFRPKNDNDGLTLHRFLKGVDGFIRTLNPKYQTYDEANDYLDNVIERGYEFDDMSESEQSDFISEIIDIGGYNAFARIYNRVLGWAKDIDKYDYWSDRDGIYKGDDYETPLDPVALVRDLMDGDDGYSYTSDFIESYIKDVRRDYLNDIENLEEWNELKTKVRSILGITSEQMENALKESETAIGVDYETSKTSDSAATRFMKALGYEGINVQGLPRLDNTEYGTVIYDLKGEDLERKKEIGTARFSSTTDPYFSDTTELPEAYEILGKSEQIEAENESIATDLKNWRAIVEKEKTLTVPNDSALREMANEILTRTKMTGNIDSLVADLKEAYGYLLSPTNVNSPAFFDKAGEIFNKLKMNDSYEEYKAFYNQLLDDMKRTLKVTDEQKERLTARYGGDKTLALQAWRGKLKISDNENIAGQSLTDYWNEMRNKYPELFKDVAEEDMAVELLKLADDTRYALDTLTEYYEIEGRRNFAVELYNQLWQTSELKTLADKGTKTLSNFRMQHFKAMSNLRDAYKTKLDEMRGKSTKYQQKISELRQQRDERERAAIQRGVTRLQNYRTNTERKAVIKRIQKNAKTLNEWLVTNSAKEHIVKPLQNPVAKLLSALDFSSERLLNGGEPTQRDISLDEAFHQVHQMVADIENGKANSSGEADFLANDLAGIDLPFGFEREMRELMNKVNSLYHQYGDNTYVLNNMSLEDLENLNKVIVELKSIVRNANHYYVASNGARVAGNAQSTIDELGLLEKRKNEGRTVRDFFSWDNALPINAFDRFGDGGKAIFRALQDGQDELAFKSALVKQFLADAYTAKELKDWRKNVRTFTIGGKEIKMTDAHLMSLYCLNKRGEAAQRHMFKELGGHGISIDTFTDFKGLRSESVENVEGTTMTEAELNSMLNTLSDRQKEVADKLQRYMSTTLSAWGNKVTNIRFGIDGFTDPNYFRIHSHTDFTSNGELDSTTTIWTLANMGFTKELNPNANNMIVITDIFSEFANHAADMARYSSLVLPVLDAYKWYTYRVTDDNNKTYSVRNSLNSAYGKAAKTYIWNLMTDINGQYNGGRGESTFKHMVAKYKQAAVGYNLRVALLQPTAYVRASLLIDPKYLAKGLASNWQRGVNMAKNHSGIALWKTFGYFDTNVGRNYTEQFLNEDTVMDKIREFGMKGAELGDRYTWGCLWNAVEAEIADKNKNMDKSSDEFVKAVSDRFRDVIYRTQVADSTLTRSQLMRHQAGMVQGLTAFASESTVSYNLFQSIAAKMSDEARRTNKATAFQKYGRDLARAGAVFTATSLLVSLVEGAIDAARDDDDKDDKEGIEEYLAKFFDHFVSDFSEEMTIIGKVPVAKLFYTAARSLLTGEYYYGSSSMDTEVIDTTYKALNDWKKMFEGKEVTAYKMLYDNAKAVSQFTGVAVNNIVREFKSLWNTIMSIFGMDNAKIDT